jgi:hypothetical protein
MPIILDGSIGITLPDSGDIFNASLIRSDTSNPPTIQNTSGTEIGTFCRAWVNFDGTTTPPTIRASFNVSGVVRTGTGQFVVTLTNALIDANGCVASNSRHLGIGGGYASCYMDTSSTIQVNSHNTVGSLVNQNVITISVFR